MTGVTMPRAPRIPANLARKGVIPAVLLAALTSPLAYTTLERMEGNILHVYRDKLSGEREVLTFDLLAIRDGKAADPLVKGNDTITVEKSAGKAFFKGVTDTMRGFISFGQYTLGGK